MFSWHWHEARDAFVRALEITPQHSRFLAQLAWLDACALGDAHGVRHAERAVLVDPQNPVVYELLSSVLECLGDDAQALAARRRALDLEPTSFANRLSRVFLTARVEGDEEGLRALRELEPSLTGDRVLSMPPVALAYARLGRDADAMGLFERFASRARQQRVEPANWYMAYLAVGDYDRAYAKLADAVEHPGPGPGFHTLMSFMRNPGIETPFDEPRFLGLRDRLRARHRTASR